MDKKIKHLEMIQNIIARLGTNSFNLKGWAVTLAVGVIALINKDLNKSYMLIAYIPLVAFWLLGAYYLYLEKLYRELYKIVLSKKENEIDFDMNIGSIKVNRFLLYFKSLKSPSQSILYLSVIILLSIVLIVVK